MKTYRLPLLLIIFGFAFAFVLALTGTFARLGAGTFEPMLEPNDLDLARLRQETEFARFLPPDQQYPEWGQCVHKVVSHPSNPDRMFLQHHWGVYRSDNAGDSWDDIVQRLPSNWRPDFVVLNAAYRLIPPGLFAAPVPLVLLAGDWNLLWHVYRTLAPHCDRILTDDPGVERFTRAGFDHARPANLYGCGRAFLDEPIADGERDIDVLFVGNLHPAIQQERNKWLARLARAD